MDEIHASRKEQAILLSAIALSDCATVPQFLSERLVAFQEESKQAWCKMSDDMNIKLHLLEAVTNNFSEDYKVGGGGFGNVYKGVYNGKDIAMKKLHNLQGLDDKQFLNELQHLRKVNHQNVVKLLGYSHESRSKFVNHGGREYFAAEMERILCFEYMHGGTLEQHIKDDSCDLDWSTCYKIIKGTCEGINHLHNAFEKPILHMDLKPANILLDNNKQAKIADLGLSKLVSSTQTYKTQSVTQGTLGYMPPEYVETAHVSRKFDVFSLGVVIIKLMAGHKGHTRFSDKGNEQFIKRVCENWRDKLQEMPTHLSHKIKTLQVEKCIEIATRCVVADRKQRPAIKDIVDELEKLEEEIKKMSLPSEESPVLTVQRSCDSNILALDPTLELRFIFEPRKDISCCLQLTNMTDQFIAFNIKTDKTKYKTQPCKGVMPPCSKGYINVTLLARDEVLPTTQCNGMFLVQTVNVDKEMKSDNITEDIFQEAMKRKVLDVVKLPIVYIGLDQFSSN